MNCFPFGYERNKLTEYLRIALKLLIVASDLLQFGDGRYRKSEKMEWR